MSGHWTDLDAALEALDAAVSRAKQRDYEPGPAMPKAHAAAVRRGVEILSELIDARWGPGASMRPL